MTVSLLNLCAPDACAHLPSVPPELLASIGGRYSRSNDGLEAILAKVEGMSEAKAIEAILRHVDYGHRSLGDMAPIALFIDGLSMLAAYTILNICQICGAQESSSRYIRFAADNVLRNVDTVAIGKYEMYISLAFEAYAESIKYWENYLTEHPEALQLPTDASSAVKQRMTKNFVFDRARYYLPVTSLTNVMLVQSAREWAALACFLQSHYFTEFNEIGAEIQAQLELAAPHFAKHAARSEPWVQFILQEDMQMTQSSPNKGWFHDDTDRANVTLLVDSPVDVAGYSGLGFLNHRTNRYGPVGWGYRLASCLLMVTDITFGEIRDLNRHRTGTRLMTTAPTGFYTPQQDVPLTMGTVLAHAPDSIENPLEKRLVTSLGHTFTWLHRTTLDKMIYETELRTGTGAHFRYAKHMHDTIDQMIQHGIPEDKIFRGRAEPE